MTQQPRLHGVEKAKHHLNRFREITKQLDVLLFEITYEARGGIGDSTNYSYAHIKELIELENMFLRRLGSAIEKEQV